MDDWGSGGVGGAGAEWGAACQKQSLQHALLPSPILIQKDIKSTGGGMPEPGPPEKHDGELLM